jgi:hypothetical protein
MPVCITGMHCSGTSTVARMLHQCGLDLGPAKRLVPADGVTRDIAQHDGFVDLDDALLAAMGGGWDHPPAAGEVVSDIGTLVTLLDRARALIGEFGGEPWGWTDPRASLTMPFWQAVVPELRVVMVVRDPREVAASLAVRNGLSRVLSVNLWQAHYDRLLRTLPPEHRIVVSDRDVFDHAPSQIRRILSFLNLQAGDDVVEGASRFVQAGRWLGGEANSEASAAELPDGVAALLAQLRREAAGESDVAPSSVGAVMRSGDSIDRLQTQVELSEVSRRQDLVLERLAGLAETIGAQHRQVPDEHGAEPAVDDEEEELSGPYGDLVMRIRDAVAGAVPPGAVVAVVSRGDDELTKLPGRKGWHFPMTDGGVYAGHYPADSDEAIAHLEQLRRKGAEYIVFPRTAQWWLTHYGGLAEHLRSRYRQVGAGQDDCVIFALAAQGAELTPDAQPGLSERYVYLRSELSAMITSILPETATVLVVSRGDDQLLGLDGRTAWHFPQTERGEYAGHYPADDVAAIDHLEVMRAAGAEYLVFPATATWWLEHYAGFRRHLEQRYRRLINQEEVCIAYDLRDSMARHTQRNGAARKVAGRG